MTSYQPTARGVPRREPSADLAGVPDALPAAVDAHRLAYIEHGGSPTSDACPFCRAPTWTTSRRSSSHRGEHAYVLLNLFPYNSGHLLVVPVPPYRDVRRGDADEVAEIGALTQTAMRVLTQVSKRDGFNIGMNQGAIAGAGIAAHLHQHVVPRWAPDSNFFPIIARHEGAPAPARRSAAGDRAGLARLNRPAAIRWTRCPMHCRAASDRGGRAHLTRRLGLTP